MHERMCTVQRCTDCKALMSRMLQGAFVGGFNSPCEHARASTEHLSQVAVQMKIEAAHLADARADTVFMGIGAWKATST
eukprot:1157936-Pelagomonas_calceolata.AAC.13